MKNVFLIGSIVFLSSFSLAAQESGSKQLDAYGFLWGEKYSIAIELFSENIRNARTINSSDLLYRGIAYFKTGDFPSAQADFIGANDLNEPEASLWLAKTYASLGSTKEAVNALQSYLENSSTVDIQEIKKEKLFKALHDTEEWFLLWQKEWLSEEQLSIVEAEYYLSKYSFEKAHEIIEQNISNAGSSASSFAYNAEIYAKEEILALSVNEINMALSLQPDNVEFLRQKADYLSKLQKYTEAVKILSEVIALDPIDFDSRYQRAKVAIEANELQLAKQDIELILKYTSDDDRVFLAARIDYSLQNYSSALKYINPLLEKDKSRADYFKVRGMIYFQTRTLKQAAHNLSMSLDLEPNDVEVNYHLGLVQNALGDNTLACYYMERTKRLGDSRAYEYLRNHCNQDDAKNINLLGE